MSDKTPRELIQVGCYLRQDQAEERGLVVLAQGVPYWIIEDEGLFCLYVEGHDAEAATLELEKFEGERDAERELEREALLQAPPPGPPRKINYFSLYIFTWVMCLFFGIQNHEGSWWRDLGAADSRAILHGELWRTVTALTLHAGPDHLFANLATGLVFAWALLPLLGSGWTWLGLVMSGAMGNTLNALIHRGGAHFSIGASTAVFGGLGMLVGWQVIAAIQRHQGRRDHPLRTREIVLPLAAGLALLTFLGVGGDGTRDVDIMAHGFGMLSGVILGIILAWTRLPEKTSERGQKALAVLALVLPGIAWLQALAG